MDIIGTFNIRVIIFIFLTLWIALLLPFKEKVIIFTSMCKLISYFVPVICVNLFVNACLLIRTVIRGFIGKKQRCSSTRYVITVMIMLLVVRIWIFIKCSFHLQWFLVFHNGFHLFENRSIGRIWNKDIRILLLMKYYET